MARRFSGTRVWSAAPNGYDVAVTLIGPVMRGTVTGAVALAAAALAAGTPAPGIGAEYGSVTSESSGSAAVTDDADDTDDTDETDWGTPISADAGPTTHDVAAALTATRAANRSGRRRRPGRVPMPT